MSVQSKKRRHMTTYYVATPFAGKVWWERSGHDKREAERLDAQRKRELKAGTFQPNVPKQSWTVAVFIADWGAKRKNVSAADDRRNLARYAALPEFASLHLADVRPRHVIAATQKLLDAGTVSAKTVLNAYGTLTTMFRDAVIAELTSATPCVLPRGFWPEDETEERQPYTREEAATLISSPAIPEPVRVLNALCLLGGLREGEACGRRWSDLDTGPSPLASLDVRTQYEGRRLKTKKPRVVPVHPELMAALEGWARSGFEALMGRAPLPEDYIVPHVSRRSRKGHWTRSTYYKAFVETARAAGVEPHTLHSTRHTMITLAQRGGAIKAVLSRVTHNAKGDIVDRYTHRDWAELCDAVLAIGSLFDARPSPRGTNEITQETASGKEGGFLLLPEKTGQEPGPLRLQFPAPPPINPAIIDYALNGALNGNGGTLLAPAGIDHRLRKPLHDAAEPGAIADYPGLTPADLADCRQIRADLRTALSQRPGLARCSAAAWALAAVASWKGVVS
jgi:integrase